MKIELKLLKARSTRMWIEQNEQIHIFNYLFYRYLTNSYRDYLLLHFTE